MNSEDHPPADERWVRAVELVGESALAFILDLEPSMTPPSTDRRRWEVVEQLGSQSFDESSLQPEQRLSLTSNLLTRVLTDTGLTVLETIRTSIGGRLPTQTGESLVDTFVRLTFNGLALEHLDGAAEDRFLVSASFQDPALHEPAANALLWDPALTTLFPQQDGEVDSRGQQVALGLLTWLPADGGTTDLRIVVGVVVAQTLARMRFDGRLNEEDLIEYVRQTLDELQRAARGEDVPVIIMSRTVGRRSRAANRSRFVGPSSGFRSSGRTLAKRRSAHTQERVLGQVNPAIDRSHP